jgi:hypothetical protein
MYDRIEAKLQGVQRALQSNRTVSTAPMPGGTTEVGDESIQLCRIVDIVKVRLQKVEEVTVQTTQALVTYPLRELRFFDFFLLFTEEQNSPNSYGA